VFGVWSLGPYVDIAGHATTLWLPATVVRWIPVLSNARIPGRAIIVVSLCCAILSAHALRWLLSRPFARAVPVAAALVTLLVLDYVPHSPAVYRLPGAALYDNIRKDGTPGAICELPLGIRDGFGETGRFDSRTLYFQTVHERPILGGFLARLPRSVVDRYQEMPIVGSLLRLSGGGSIDEEHADRDRSDAAHALASLGIRYFVIDRTTAPPDLLRYVRMALPLRLIAQDDERALYVVDPSVF
jgi:hypothetical protein